MEAVEVLSHFGKLNEEVLNNFTKNHFKQFLFVTKTEYGYEGYCTRCESGGNIETTEVKHKSKTLCPFCHESVEIRLEYYGRKSLIQQGYFIRFEQSVIDGSLVARGIYAVRDLSGDLKSKQIYCDKDYYIFTPKPVHVSLESIFYTQSNKQICSWGRQSKYIVASSFREGCYYFNSRQMDFCTVDTGSFSRADKGVLKYSGWESWGGEEVISYLNMHIKWPCVEYISKLEFKHLISDYIERERVLRKQ